MGDGRRHRTVSEDLVATAQRSLLLGSLPPATLTDVMDAARLIEARRGELLRRPYDDALILVVNGAGIARTADLDRSFVVTGLLGPGEVWGISDTLGHPNLITEVEALTETDVLALSGPVLRRAIAQHPSLATACLRLAAAHLAVTNEESAIFANTSTTERVIERLLQLTERFGAPDRRDPGRVRIPLPLTQQDLASWARVSRESLVRTLQALRREGVVDTQRREITILDVDRLAARRTSARPDPAIQRMLHSIA